MADHHAERALVALGLTLRQGVEVGNFGGGEKHRGRIRAGGNAGSATDARRRVKRRIGRFFWNQDRIGVGSASRGRADEAPRLNDAVKG